MWSIGDYNIKAILEGGMSLLPGSARLFRKGTRGTDSARYCYSVWMRHLVRTHAHRCAPLNGIVVELGPGDSLGVGLASLLSGARRYVAVDVVRHADAERNIQVFEELISLFATRVPIPNSKEFPGIKPRLDDHRFPSAILDAEWMGRTLDSKRLQAIARSLRGAAEADPPVKYVDPSRAGTTITEGSVDMLFSQAVLEHIDDLAGVYRTCFAWLKRNGLMSHQIDFKSHGSSHAWNGHWVYPDPVWRLIRGNRPYLINREPCSTHLRHLAESGFEVVAEERTALSSRLRREQLAARFRRMSDDDLTTAGVFVVARRMKTRAGAEQR
jgi:hypothetical protein